jgi:hypothetical protein
MLPIIQNWKQYFTDHNEGIGTTYERFILNSYFNRIKNDLSIRSVLEAPLFGMTGVSGINSMWWATKGVDVTLIDSNRERVGLIRQIWKDAELNADVLFLEDGVVNLPFADRSFDLGWNFASLWFVRELEPFLKELTRVSRKAVFICVPNKHNLFNAIRLKSMSKANNVHIENIYPSLIRQCMDKVNWQAAEEGYLDCPPWPDIAMKKEDMLRKVGLSFLVKSQKTNNENGLCILDYFNGKKPEMEKEILKHAWLENMPDFLKKLWAHHQYFIFVPKGEDK